nr:MAG TPA: virion morphogenesis protein [Caudoviricetes sp.]
MADVVLETILDVRRPTLRIKAFQDKVDGASLAGFLQGFAAPLLQDRAHTRFEEEGDDASGKWKPLAESTIARRESKGYVPIKINDRTGLMRQWVESAPGRISAVKYAAVLDWPGTPDNRTIGKKLKVAQQGLSDPYTPARPVVAVDSDDLLTILVAMENWIGAVP